MPFSFNRFDATVDHEWARESRYASDHATSSIEAVLQALLYTTDDVNRPGFPGGSTP